MSFFSAGQAKVDVIRRCHSLNCFWLLSDAFLTFFCWSSKLKKWPNNSTTTPRSIYLVFNRSRDDGKNNNQVKRQSNCTEYGKTNFIVKQKLVKKIFLLLCIPLTSVLLKRRRFALIATNRQKLAPQTKVVNSVESRGKAPKSLHSFIKESLCIKWTTDRLSMLFDLVCLHLCGGLFQSSQCSLLLFLNFFQPFYFFTKFNILCLKIAKIKWHISLPQKTVWLCSHTMWQTVRQVCMGK